jgi:hypothetical protein
LYEIRNWHFGFKKLQCKPHIVKGDCVKKAVNDQLSAISINLVGGLCGIGGAES